MSCQENGETGRTPHAVKGAVLPSLAAPATRNVALANNNDDNNDDNNNNGTPPNAAPPPPTDTAVDTTGDATATWQPATATTPPLVHLPMQNNDGNTPISLPLPAPTTTTTVLPNNNNNHTTTTPTTTPPGFVTLAQHQKALANETFRYNTMKFHLCQEISSLQQTVDALRRQVWTLQQRQQQQQQQPIMMMQSPVMMQSPIQQAYFHLLQQTSPPIPQLQPPTLQQQTQQQQADQTNQEAMVVENDDKTQNNSGTTTTTTTGNHTHTAVVVADQPPNNNPDVPAAPSQEKPKRKRRTKALHEAKNLIMMIRPSDPCSVHNNDNNNNKNHPPEATTTTTTINFVNQQRRTKWDDNWDEKFAQLQAYYHEHGHCNVPRRPSPAQVDDLTPAQWQQQAKLGAWVSIQRSQHAKLCRGLKHDLTPYRMQQLSSLGFSWRHSKTPPVPWETRFGQLQLYHQQHGHTRVPQKWTKPQGLGNWVLEQRKMYRERQRLLLQQQQADDDDDDDVHGRARRFTNTTLTQEKIDKLESLGFEWTLRHRGPRSQYQQHKHLQDDDNDEHDDDDDDDDGHGMI